MATGPVLLSSKELERLVADGSPVLVEFYTPTCPHCAALEPTIEQLARAWGERATVAQLNLHDEPRAIAQWKIMGTPTVIVFAGGDEVTRLTGVQARRQYERALQGSIAESDSTSEPPADMPGPAR